MSATDAAAPALVTLDDLRAAAAVLHGVAVRTPLLPADEALPEPMRTGRVWVKPEMLQRGGAFKLRGAYTFLAGLAPEVRARGVVAPSSGNHAQAVALAARLFGVPATVVMPTTVTPAKRGGAERLGARIELAGTTTADRMARAEAIVAESGGVLVPPYDHPTIIAGQGTAGLELVEDLPDVRLVLVPVGGGGLSAGVATAVKLLSPGTRVVGVEPAGAPKLSRARAEGRPVHLGSTRGLADGLLAVEVGHAPFAHHQAYVDEVVTVDDAALVPAMRALLDRLKLVAEPSGAITLAALREGLVAPAAEGHTVCVLSGGNIEWAGLQALLIVDDDPAVVESVSWVLQEHGYVVSAAPGAQALLSLLDDGAEQRPPDLLLLDIYMPDGDGVQLLERIKRDARWREVPVLMLSSAPVEEATVRTLGLGAADYVRKPFRVKELVARIQAQLRAGAQLRTTRDALRRTQVELERARTDAENRRKLVDILHEVTGDLAADEVYHLLARRVARALSVSHCAVILAGSTEDAGIVATAFENPKLQKAELAIADYPEVRQALESGAPVLLEDVGTDPLYASRAPRGLDGADVALRSTLALPFAIDRAQRGVFLLRRTREQPPLTPEDVDFAEAVISAAVAVVQRAQVIETTRADNARLEQLATTDPLTQLLNRRALTDRLTQEMERALRYDGSVALLLIDLDHFKRVNDTHGHLVGDAVLRDVSELLLAAARSTDLVARYGGEEFLVVLPETEDDGAAAFAERLRERVEAHPFLPWEDGRELRMTASIGVATFPAARIESVEDLFARADAALYRAKADGRNRVRL